MHKPILISLIVFGFIIVPGNSFRQEIYRLIEEKGTINLSDSATSSVVTTREADKQNGEDVLKRDETANGSGQGIYRSVDEKGTINFSDTLTSPVITTKKGAPKQDGAEVLRRNEVVNQSPVAVSEGLKRPAMTSETLKRNETANQRPMTESEIQAKLLTMRTWSSEGISSGGGSRTVRS